ncbi:MAG: protein kinase [Planctomycetes bacterium]|nr:protein kinase [Planctomycetota bacterium]
MALPSDKHPDAAKEKPDATVVTEGSAGNVAPNAREPEDPYATLASSRGPDAAAGKPLPDASLATLALSGEAAPEVTCGPSDKDDVRNVAPDTCHLAPEEVAPPTEQLSHPKESITPLDQTLNMPSDSLPAAGHSPGWEEPPKTEAMDASLGDGTQVLSELGGRQQESPLDQTLAEPPPSEALAASSSGGTDLLTAPPTQHADDPGRPLALTLSPTGAPAPAGRATSADVRARRTVVPGYEVLGELGRGGMGVVYKARQLRLNRLVALKMIRSGAQAGSDDLVRFRKEAEAVAKLHHPNIVQIYEIGEADGLPFFSLEFVDGGSLHERLSKDTGLPARQAAEVVEALARAMHYAHACGVVHRDLKPANVLLSRDPASGGREPPDSSTPSGGSRPPLTGLVPKITDFGLAKHLETDTHQTREGSILGTPSYMAPEQAEGRNKDIGPPADIYALGAILYDLLASRPPFRGETVMDTLQQVIYAEPVPPTRLQPKLPRDLETICLKCLQKEPKNRYAAAGDLADDLRRFLGGEPIQARATPVWEKAVKWARRRPAAAALVGFAFLTVIGLIVGSSVYAGMERRRANREAELKSKEIEEHQRADRNAEREKEQRQRADKEAVEAKRQRKAAEEARDEAKREKEEERRQRLRADRRTRDAVEAVDRLLVHAGDLRLEHIPELQDLRRDFLLDALDFSERFLRDNSDDVVLRDQTGFAHRRAAIILDRLGERTKAVQSYRQALDYFEGLRKSDPDNDYYCRNVALASNDLGIALHAGQKQEEAAKHFDDAVRLLRAVQARQADPHALFALSFGAAVVGPAHPPGQRWHAVWQMIVAATETEKARIDRALLADAHLHRGNLRLTRGQVSAAAEDFQSAVPLYEQLHVEVPQTTAYQARLAEANSSLGVLLQGSDPKRAIQALDRAAVLLKPLTERFAWIGDYRAALAQVHRNRGALRYVLALRQRQQKASPLPHCGRSEERSDEESPPEVKQVYGQVGEDLRRSVDLLAKLAADYRAVPEHREQLIQVRQLLAFVTHSALQDPREAARVWQDVIDDVGKLPPKFRSDPRWRLKLAIAYDGLAQAYSAAQVRRIQDANQAWRKAIDVTELLVEEYEGEQVFWKQWVDSYLNRIVMWKGQGRLAEAERDCRTLVSILEKRARKFSTATHLAELASAHHEWALLLRQRGQRDDAERHLKQAVAWQREVLLKAPTDACQFWSLCVYQLAASDDQAAETVSAWVKAVPENQQPRYHEAAWCLVQCAAQAVKQGKNTEPLAGRAVELLRKAAGQGTLDARFLSKKEFDPLRERHDFKQVERSLTKPK